MKTIREILQSHHCHCNGPAELCRCAEETIENALMEGASNVLCIRCIEHRNTPSQNQNEASGGECGGCIAAERDKWKATARTQDEEHAKTLAALQEARNRDAYRENLILELRAERDQWRNSANYLNSEAEKMRALIKDLLFAAENADETGYVTDVGFIDLEALHAKARAV